MFCCRQRRLSAVNVLGIVHQRYPRSGEIMFSEPSAYATPWWKHVRDFWKTQNDPSLLVLKYEEIVEDMHGAVKTIADHIDTHVTDDEVQEIVDHCTFEKMKQNASTNDGWMSKEKDMDARFGGHIRRGKVGGWKDFLDPEMSEKVDAMVSEQLGGTDLRFHYGDICK